MPNEPQDPTAPQHPTAPQDPTAPPPAPDGVADPATPGSSTPPPPGTTAEGAPSGSPSKSRRTLLVALIAAVVVVVGGGAAAAFFMMRGSSEQLVGFVPADADAFATVYLDPSAGQKVNLLALTEKFPDLGEGERLSTKVDDLLDQALTGSGLTSQDVRPWLGSQIGVSMDLDDDATPHVAALIATTDPDAALAAMEKLPAADSVRLNNHDGVEVSVAADNQGAYAIVDDVLILASDETTVKRAIDAAHDTLPNLGDAQIYTDTLAGLPEGKLGVAYLNVEGLVEQFGSVMEASASLGAGGLGNLEAVESLGMSVSAEAEGVAVDVAMNFDPAKLTPEMRENLAAPDHDNTALAFVPADAFAVAAVQNADVSLGASLDAIEEEAPDAAASIDQAGIRGFIEAMNGDVALEAGPGTDGPVSGALLVGTDDPAEMQAFLDTVAGFALQGLAQASGESQSAPVGDFSIAQQAPPPLATEEYEGVTIASFEDPSLRALGFAPAYAVMDGAGVVATSPEEIHQLIDTQAGGDDVRSAPLYDSATASVPTQESVFFLDIHAIADTVRENLPPEEQAVYDQEVAPNLEPLTAFVVGGESDEEQQIVRMFLQIR